MPLDFEFILRFSLASSAILLAGVVCLTALLLGAKIFRQLWQRYRRHRERAYRPAVLQLIGGDSEGSGRAALLSWRYWGDWWVVEGLLLQWSRAVKGEAHEQICAIFSAGGFADYEIRRLGSRRWWIRATAAQRLGLMRCEKAAPDLVLRLDDSALDVRLAAASALGLLGDWPAVGRIVESLAHLSRLAALRVTNIIVDMGPSSIPIIAGILHSSDRATRLLALNALGALGTDAASRLALSCLGDADVDIRIAACQALGGLDKTAALQPLQNALGDAAWPVRARASLVVGQLKLAQAAGSLMPCLEDRAWWVRYNAGQAMARLGEAGKKALQESLASPDRFARDMAAQWLDELAAGGAA